VDTRKILRLKKVVVLLIARLTASPSAPAVDIRETSSIKSNLMGLLLKEAGELAPESERLPP
jgi:hypothetical protein